MITAERAEVRAPLDPEASSAAEARSVVRRALSSWGLSSIEEVACLLVSELVANLVLHAASPGELTLWRRGDLVHVGVSDHDPRPPRRLHRPRLAGSGRGLALVEDLADTWGYEASRDGVGKTVWFELRSQHP